MASKETDQYTTQPTSFIETEGTSLKSALDVARKFGAVRDSVLPFASGALYTGDTQTFYALASQLKILTYFNLGTTLGNWKTWLATRARSSRAWTSTRRGTPRPTTRATWTTTTPTTPAAGTASPSSATRKDRFIVRNSWGTSWGDKGFAYASLDYAQAAFTEAYGIQV